MLQSYVSRPVFRPSFVRTAPTPRYDVRRVLTDDELYRYAPSLFATSAHESRSERFKPIPTIQVIEALRDEGFFPVSARQAGSRDASKRAFTKHLVRFRRMDDEAKRWAVGDVFPDICLVNANDGTSGYGLYAGIFRIACLNGMITGDILDTVKVRHTGDAIGKVIEGTYKVLDSARAALASPEAWSQMKLDREQALAFANAAHVLRFADSDGTVNTPFRPEQLLSVRRAEDQGADLWTVTNVVQENVIRGGLRARTQATHDSTGRYVPSRRVTTREISGIDQDVKLNRALWVLAERMAGMLKAA